MKSIDRDALESVPILISEEGFPGELSPTDAARARQLIRSSDAEAVLVAAGDEVFWWVDAVGQQGVRLVGSGTGTGTGTRGDGFALGTGDRATVPGVPLDWDLLMFSCPRGDTTVLLARYPAEPPWCPTHHVPLEFQDAGR